MCSNFVNPIYTVKVNCLYLHQEVNLYYYVHLRDEKMRPAQLLNGSSYIIE